MGEDRLFRRILKHKAFIWISIPVLLLAVIFASVTLFMHSALFKDISADLVSEYVFRGGGCQLILGEVSGNPLTNLQIKDIAVRCEQGTHSYDKDR
jgi:hypothetical protein